MGASEDLELHRLADRLFAEALDLPLGEREAFLRRSCGGRAEVVDLVNSLLSSASDETTERWSTGGAACASVLPDLSIRDLSGTSLGRYRLVREVGRGGMGAVYEATDEHLGRRVAVKVLVGEVPEPATLDRFLLEARAAAALHHPGVVTLFDAAEEGGRPFLVMEWVGGGNLESEPPSSIGEALEIARELCDGLEHAHERGLVHRDLKPANVLIDRQGPRRVVKLADLGIALTRGADRVTLTGVIAGTPTYMSPEQALGGSVDGRSDLYALGVMLYLWIAGRPPFSGDNALAVVSQHIHAPVVPLRAYREDVPRVVDELVCRLLAKNPDDRFTSATELAQALDRLDLSGEGPASSASLSLDGLARGRLVGREDEVRLLETAWRTVDRPLVLVSGEPGIGKTRLIREMSAMARMEGALVLSGGCSENEGAPYLPFVEALRRWVRDLAEEELRTLLSDSMGEIARLVPEIETRLGPASPRAPLSGAEERLRLFSHLGRVLDRVSRERRTLVLLDDLQWADQGTLALLHDLLRQRSDGERSTRILFAATHREVHSVAGHPLARRIVSWERESVALRIPLERLDAATSRRMVGTLLGQDVVDEDLASSIHAETEGNPFFIEEIVKALVADGGLEHRGAGWKLRTTRDLVLPPSIREAVGSRIERVGTSCTKILRAAAVLGKRFEFEELTAICDVEEDELLDALDHAVAAQLLESAGGETFAFTHDKIREVLAAEMNPVRRRRLHLRIAKGLEALRSSGHPVAIADLAHHALESGDPAKGLRFAREAVDAARQVFAHDEVVALLERGRACAEKLGELTEVLRIDEELGRASQAQGDLVRATELFENALERSLGTPGELSLRCRLAEAYVIAGDPRGEEHARVVLDLVNAGEHPRELAVAYMVQARSLHLRGDLEQAAAILRETVTGVRKLEDPDLLGRLLSYLAGSYQHLARLDESNEVARECVAIGEREESPSAVLLGLEFQCENASMSGNWQDCIRLGEREESLARRVGAGDRFLWSHYRAFGLHGAGRLAEAEALFAQGARACEVQGEKRLGLLMILGLGTALIDRGRSAEGLAHLDRGVVAADEAGWVYHRIVAHAYRARALSRAGRLKEAIADARSGARIWFDSGSRGPGLLHGTELAEAFVRAGFEDEAEECLERHREIVETTGSRMRRGDNLRVEAMMWSRRGDFEKTLALIDEAIALFEETASPLHRAWALEVRAEAFEGLGRSEEAAEARREAREGADRCGATGAVTR